MAIAVMCGVPTEHCTGARIASNAFLRNFGPKAHNSHEEAYKCYRRYLIRVMGYEDIGSRTFRPPDGGPLRVLTKKSRFGARLRYGKLGERWMPEEKGRSGAVIGT